MRREIRRLIISLAMPTISGIAAAYYTPLSFWFDMKEGLIAFMGFVAASIMQVMPITANFLQADRLNPSDAKRIVASLTRQQHYWIGLLSATIGALLILIIGSALKTYTEKLTSEWYGISYSGACCFLIAASFTFVLIKMIGLFEGMLSLHRLRAELVLEAANRTAAETKAEIQSRVKPIRSFVPEDYGRIMDPPKE